MTATAAPPSGPSAGNAAAALDTRTVRKSRRRTAELVLLAFVVVTASLGMLVIDVGYDDNWQGDWIRLGIGMALVFAAAHVAVRILAPYADPLIFPLPAMLAAVGVVVIHRVDLGERDQVISQGGEVTSSGLAGGQILWILLGVLMMATTLAVVRDHRMLVRFMYLSGLLGLLLLALPGLLPASITEVNGAKIWIKTPWFSIQPLEFAKPLLVIFFAGYLMLKREVLSRAGKVKILGVRFPRMRDAFVLFAAWILSMIILVLEGELGTTMLFYGAFVGMLYVATRRVAWILLGIGTFVAGYAAVYFFTSQVTSRVDCWLNPFSDPSGKCFQVVQARYAMAAGGLFGTGLAEGNPEIVPEARTDFIFAAICELLGLVGATAVLLFIVQFATRGARTGLLTRDPFGRMMAVGLAFMLALQYFIILGGVTGLMPLTGITAPFLSYGGSSTLANFIIVGLLLRISNAARQPPGLPATGGLLGRRSKGSGAPPGDGNDATQAVRMVQQ